MSGHLCLKWNNHSTAFIKSISNIQTKERYCDATIVCQGKYFPVHRVVLSTCSDYFDEMFERMQCQHPYIVFKDIDPKEMEMLLNYMYQGEVNVVQENLPTLIKAAEALRIKGLAVPDDLPSKESSGKKRSSASNDVSVPKKRCEEKRRRRDSADHSSHPSTSCSSSNRENLNDSIEAIERKSIKEEPLDTGYRDPPLSTDYGEVTYSGSESMPVDANQASPSDKLEDHFVNFPLSKETDTYIKQEQETVPTETLNDEQPSSWSDFASDDILQDLPPETSGQDDINETSKYIQIGSSPHEQQLKIQSERRKRKPPRGHRCPYCGYESTTPHNIRNHIRFKHTGERPFQCSFCPKRFAQKSYLYVHTRTHTGERPYKCEMCSKTFLTSWHLKSHKATCTHGSQWQQ